MIFNVGAGNGGSVVYLTQAEYDALPDSKLSNNIEYRIIDGDIGVATASNLSYDNSFSGLEAVSVQGAVDELNDNMGGLRFGYDGDSNTYGYYGADDSFIPFKSGFENFSCEEYIPINGSYTCTTDATIMLVSNASFTATINGESIVIMLGNNNTSVYNSNLLKVSTGDVIACTGTRSTSIFSFS